MRSGSLYALAPARCSAPRYLSASLLLSLLLMMAASPLNRRSTLPRSVLNSAARLVFTASRGMSGINSPLKTILN